MEGNGGDEDPCMHNPSSVAGRAGGAGRDPQHPRSEDEASEGKGPQESKMQMRLQLQMRHDQQSARYDR
jgi:hypothetical protein